MFRLDAGKGQMLRIAYMRENDADNSLRQDKESLFWLNVLWAPQPLSGKETVRFKTVDLWQSH
jgi:P pilus assembly chaperone PapD